MVALSPTVPALFEPLIFQPPMATGAPERLYSSTNSSFPPFGPRTRNSLITIFVETACTRDEKLKQSMNAKIANITIADATNTRDCRVEARGLIRRMQSFLY